METKKFSAPENVEKKVVEFINPVLTMLTSYFLSQFKTLEKNFSSILKIFKTFFLQMTTDKNKWKLTALNRESPEELPRNQLS